MIRYCIVLFFLVLQLQAQTTQEACDKLIASGIDALYTKKYARSLELLTEAKTAAESHHWPKQLFLATNNIGLNYYSMLDYGEALEYYFSAYELALKMDSSYEMIVLNNIAVLYLDDNKLEEAEKYFLKAYAIARQHKINYKIGMYAGNLAAVYNVMKKVEKSEAYLDIALPLTKDEPRLLAQTELTRAENMILRQEYDLAEKTALELLPHLNDIEYSQHKTGILMILSKVYEAKEHNPEKALQMAFQALKVNKDQRVKIEVLDRISDLYRKENNYNKAFAYKDSLISAKDSLSRVRNKILFTNSKIKLELQMYQKELSDNQQRMATERKIGYTLMGIGLIIIITIGWALYNNAVKYRQKRIISERNQQIITLELEKQLREKEVLALLEQEQLKSEIEAKNRKLAAKALDTSNRNELIEDIVNSLSEQPELASNQTLKKHLLQLKKHLQNDNEWNDFLTHFEEVNHGFLVHLKEKHPDLNPNDIRFLLYTYMNLSIKEIATLFSITPEACRKRRERICKKMGIADSMILYTYLSTL